MLPGHCREEEEEGPEHGGAKDGCERTPWGRSKGYQLLKCQLWGLPGGILSLQ